MIEHFDHELLFTPAEVLDLLSQELRPKINALESFYKQNEENSQEGIHDLFKKLFIEFATELADESPLIAYGLGYKNNVHLSYEDDGKTFDVIADLSNKLRLVEEYCMLQSGDDFQSEANRSKCFHLFITLLQASLNAAHRFVVILGFPQEEMNNAFRGTGKYCSETQVQ